MTVLGDPIFSHYRQCLSRNYMTRMVLELFIQPEDIDSNSRLDLRVCSLVLVSTFAISLTFGMIFAPLGVVGAVAVFAHSYYSQVHLARTFRELRSRSDELTIAYERIVDKDCEVFVESLAESLRVLPMLAALFYACFIVDILGDAEGAGAILTNMTFTHCTFSPPLCGLLFDSLCVVVSVCVCAVLVRVAAWPPSVRLASTRRIAVANNA